MKYNETLISYPGREKDSGYQVRIYKSVVDFTCRDFFEHRHSDFEISYILEGKGVYQLRDGVFDIDQGDIFLIGSNQVHCIIESAADLGVSLINVQFEPRMIWSPLSNPLGEEYLDLFNGKCEKIGRESPYYPNIAEKMKRIYAESIDRRIGYQVMIRSYLHEILTELMRNYGLSVKSVQKEKRLEKLICMDRAMSYINEHLDETLSLTMIAQASGFSRTYFSKVFNALNGLSLWEYITIQRIEKSKKLLSLTDLSVIEIASSCGYENLSNFNRMFSRTVGTTPSAYRKQQRNR